MSGGTHRYALPRYQSEEIKKNHFLKSELNPQPVAFTCATAPRLTSGLDVNVNDDIF